MKLLVVGATGLLGSHILRYGRSLDIDVVGTYYQNDSSDGLYHLDKTDAGATSSLVSRVEPDTIIDTAAFHAVDACETERDRAYTVNATGTRHLAAAAESVSSQFVYLSTDYVFSGEPTETPYTESDAVSPPNYYGQTKYAGEQSTKIASEWTVIRPSVVYGFGRNNFVTWALNELRSGSEIDIVDDQISTPTYVVDLARACVEISADSRTGVYHATGPESLSRYDFTKRMASTFDLDTDLVNPIDTAELGQEAPRPVDSSLNSTKLYETVGYEFRSPTEAFEAMRQEAPWRNDS